MENISVSVRIRPLSKSEAQNEGGGMMGAWRIDDSTIFQASAGVGGERNQISDARYTLDNVFGPSQSTREIYEHTASPLIHKVVNGFNATIFAYGQTSSGKTFTMRGSGEEPGMIPLAVHEVFSLIEASQEREYLIRVSYTELYNEEVNDLLAPENTKLPIHESKENGIYVCGLREDIVTSPDQVLGLLEEGENNRHIGSTKMNEKSSRSHTLFRMVIESRARGGVEADPSSDGAILVSTLTLVDLAGSERVAKTGAEGIRMKEGTAINKSLLTLGNVINKLAEGVNGGHIPYRDSKLTRILQPSLGGNAKTAVICAMTPASCHAEESHSTLRFASRAKSVVNNAVVNEVLSDAAVLKRQAKEIEELKKRLGASCSSSSAPAAYEMNGQVGQLRAQLLRSEQEMQLMRMKLEEERAEREKAQKQAEAAKKMIGLSGASAGDDSYPLSKRSSRRETWCPGGKGGWAPPPGVHNAGASPASSMGGRDSDAGLLESGGRRNKRPLSMTSRRSRGVMGRRRGTGSSALEQLNEVDENQDEMDDETVVDEDEEEMVGPTPQRRRKESSLTFTGSLSGVAEEEMDSASEQMVSDVERVAQGLSANARRPIEALLREWRESQMKGSLMQRELDEVTSVAQERQVSLRSAEEKIAEASKMAPQLEQVRWQARQAQKKLEDLTAVHQEVIDERDAALNKLQSFESDTSSKIESVKQELALMAEDRSLLREQLKKALVELADCKGQVELQISERAILEARSKAHSTELSEGEMKIKDRVREMESLKKQMAAQGEAMVASESKVRELYEINQRLEAHVHDLESRKRAPLYQKKQEAELLAVKEKAAEAEVRAHDAESKAKELQEAAEEAETKVAEAKEAMERSQRSHEEAISAASERHQIEIQRMQHDRSLLLVEHSNEIEAGRIRLVQMEASLATLKAELNDSNAALASSQAGCSELQAQIEELNAAQVDLNSCVTAASERIGSLEEESQKAEAEHEEKIRHLIQEHDLAIKAAEEKLASAQSEAQSVATQLRSQAEAEKAELSRQLLESSSELEAEQARSKQFVLSSIEECQGLGAAKAELEQQVLTLQAKVNEAAGALKAKEELKEERLSHKQEVSSLKAELQKFQLESKTKGKGEEMAGKEVEALKRKVVDLDAKLKLAVTEKQAAVAEKGNIERQLKQASGQKLLIEKSLEKKDQLESKKRESIMVNLNKSKEQLNSTEERLKQAAVDLQKMAMDLLASKQECAGLEEQVSSLDEASSELKRQVSGLTMELTTVTHNLDCARNELSETKSELIKTSDGYSAAQEELAQLKVTLANLETSHSISESNLSQSSASLIATSKALDDLKELHESLVETDRQSVVKIADLERGLEVAGGHLKVVEESARVMKVKLEEALMAKVAAEARLPEIDELQKLLSATNEELSDATFCFDEAKAALATMEKESLEARSLLEAKIKTIEEAKEKVVVELTGALAASEDLKGQMSEALELYEIEKMQSSRQEQSAISLQFDYETKMQALKTEVTEMESQLLSLRSEVDKSSLRDAAGIEAEERLKVEIKRLQSHVEGLESRLNLSALGAARDLERGLEVERAERRAVEMSLEAAREALGVAEGEVKMLKGEVDRITLLSSSAASEARSEAESARKAAEDAEVLNQELKRSNAELDVKLRQALRSKEEAIAHSNDLATQIDELSDSVKRLERDLTAARSDAEKRGALASQQQTIDNLQEELGIVSKRAEAQSNLAVTLREQVVLLQKEVKESRPDPQLHQKWQGKVHALEKDLAIARSQYEAAERRCQESQDIIDEIDLNSKAKEAELNAKFLSMESQVHWLTEQNKKLMASSKPPPSQTHSNAELEEMKQKHQVLEQELRRAKRAEQKMQAMLFRLRKDVEEKGSDLGGLLGSLQDVRSLQYDVDLLTQKIKRYEKQFAHQGADQGAGRALQAVGGNGSKQQTTQPPTKVHLVGALKSQGAAAYDKENAPLL